MAETDDDFRAPGAPDHLPGAVDDSSEDLKEEQEQDDPQDEQEQQLCYICWDAGTEDDPIRRDCDCRGTAGLVHASCLIEAASAAARNGSMAGMGIGGVFDPVLRPWSRCRQCCAPYREPTRSILSSAMAERSPGMRKRLVKSVGRLGLTVAAYSAYFAFASCFEYYLERFLVDLLLQHHQRRERKGHGDAAWMAASAPRWASHPTGAAAVMAAADAAGPAIRIFVAAAVAGLLLRTLWVNRRAIWRNFVAQAEVVATLASSAILLAEALNIVGRLDAELFAPNLSAVVAALAVVSFEAHRHRRAARDALVRLRRDGFLGPALGFLAAALLLMLQLGIDQFVRSAADGYYYGGSDVLLDDRRRLGLFGREHYTGVVKGRELIARKIMEEDFRNRQLLRMEIDEYLRPIRDEYWYCCA